MEKICCVCGRPFKVNTRTIVCSEECKKKQRTMYHRKWVADNLEKNRAYMRDYMRTGEIHGKKGVKHYVRKENY